MFRNFRKFVDLFFYFADDGFLVPILDLTCISEPIEVPIIFEM